MYQYWTHGVQTIVEFPEHASRISHAGWGTLIEQQEDPSGRNNWFHLPLHTPNWIPRANFERLSDPSDRVQKYNPQHVTINKAILSSVRLKADVNENASIRTLHIRAGDRLLKSEEVDLRGPSVNHEVNMRDPRTRSYSTIRDEGVTLCVRVAFLSGSPRGRVIFRGGGAYYLAGGEVSIETWF